MASGLRRGDKQKSYTATPSAYHNPNLISALILETCCMEVPAAAQIRCKYHASVLFNKTEEASNCSSAFLHQDDFWADTSTVTRTKLKMCQLRSVFISPRCFPLHATDILLHTHSHITLANEHVFMPSPDLPSD